MVSYHTKDIATRYCGNCHEFHSWRLPSMPSADPLTPTHVDRRCDQCGERYGWASTLGDGLGTDPGCPLCKEPDDAKSRTTENSDTD